MSKIIRVFRAKAKPGSETAFKSFFLKDALGIVKSQRGLSGVQIGLPTPERPRDFLMITVWDSLEALVGFAGENWNEAVIDPREAPMLSQVSVEHYLEHTSAG